jgi:hypothetical protein
MRYHVPLYGQRTSRACWATSLAMILSWSGRATVTPESVRDRTGYVRQYNQTGLDAWDAFPLTTFGLVAEAPQTYTVTGFMDLLHHYGPLWCAVGPDLDADGVLDPHVVVVTGFDPDADASKAQVHINDPWRRGMRTFSLPNTGSAYVVSYAQYVTGLLHPLARDEIGVAGALYVAHLPARPHGD